MARVLVLGGGGFIGANLIESLLGDGHVVRVLERPNVQPLFPVSITRQVQWHVGDITNTVDVEAALLDQDYVYHLVSTTLPKSSNDNPAYDVDSNVVATIRMLEIACRLGVKRIVFISSGGTVYGPPRQVPIPEEHPTEPICSYGIGKLAIEKYLALFQHLKGLEYTVLRLANPFGRYQRPHAVQGAIAVFLHRARNNLPIEIWGDGTIVRDYIYIADVVDAMIRCLSYQGEHRVFNLGSGRGASLNEIVDAIATVIGHPVEVTFSSSRAVDVPVNVLDISRIRREFQWSPQLSLLDGIRKTCHHLPKSPQ